MPHDKHDLLADLQKRGAGGLKYILESISDFVVVLDREGRMLYVNHVRDEDDWFERLRGQSIFLDRWLSPESQVRIREGLEAVFERREHPKFEIQGVSVEDLRLEHWYWSRMHPFIRDGEVIAAVYVSTEITDQKRAQRWLTENEELQRSLLHDMSEGVFAIDADGRVTVWNLAMEHFTGVDAAGLIGSGRPVWEHFPEFPEKGIRKVMEIVSTGRELRRERMVPDPVTQDPRHYVGVYRALGLGKQRPGLLGVLRDVTELRRSQAEQAAMRERLHVSQKLESLGVLAGGIAHDFNNLLVAILGYAELAQAALDPAHKAHGMITQVMSGAQKAADLCQQMLAYSGRGTFVVHPVDLNRLISEMGSLLEVSISKKAALLIDLEPGGLFVEADSSQVNQILLNLLLNASDALGPGGGGIAIRTRRRECDAQWLRSVWSHADLPGGGYAEVEISDTGCGMDARTRERIFEPFFSTKFTGRGLGMAAVLGIVRAHHGAITVESAPGQGTTFRILLPLLDGEREAAPPREAAAEWPARMKVLAVDDDPIILEFLATVLEMHGCEVLRACDGLDAVEIFKADPAAVSLVILDMTMPRLDGIECFRELRRIRPDVRVMLSSGYSEQDAINEFSGEGLAGFLQKPYSLDKLRAAISAALR